MKILSLFVSFLALQAVTASAQNGALSQLKISSPDCIAADAQGPAASPAASVRNTLLLLDPRNGQTLVVIPVGGGYIVALSGKYVPAVFNGSGYLLLDGTFMPVVGGSRKAPASGKAQSAGAPAKTMWQALNFVALLEDADFHVISGGKDVLAADSVSCVDENYVACSMFVNVNGERKLLVTLDGGAKVIRALYANGFEFDHETGILYAASVSCSRNGEDYSCDIKP